MPSRRGSWPALIALAAAFVLLFYWQRSRSTFLRIELERPEAAQLAKRAGIDVADVLALRDMIGLEASVADWRGVVADFSGKLKYLRSEQTGSKRDVRGARSPVTAEISLAASLVAQDPLAVRRFLLLRERFGARR